MVATRSGLLGLSVAGHVMEELNIVIVHARVPPLQTEEETAVDWDELTSHGHVTHFSAEVNDMMSLAQEHNTMSPSRTARSGVERINHEATVPSTFPFTNVFPQIYSAL